MDNPSSPYGQIQSLVEQFGSGQAPPEACLRGLDAVEEYFRANIARMDGAEAPGPQLARIKSQSLEAFDLFLQAVEHLRDFIRESDQQACQDGLACARDGQDRLDSLVHDTAAHQRDLKQQLEILRVSGISAQDGLSLEG